MAKLTPMLQQYFDIKEQHKDAILFFHLGDFYEMFGPDAIEASRILDLTLTARGKGTENEIPMCGVPVHAGSGYIAKLTKAGKKIAVCEQVSDPDGKGIVQRAVTQVITPGTTFDEQILEGKEQNFLCAVVKQGSEYGLGAVDATTGHFQVGAFDSLLRVKEELGRFNPAELLFSGLEESEQSELSPVASLSSSAWPAWQDPQAFLKTHFETVGLEQFGLQDSVLLQTVAAHLLHYLKETQKSSLGHIRAIETLQDGDAMVLDEATMRNLELFSTQQTGQEQGSLVAAIDLTQTGMGGRLLRWWVTHPLIDAAEIESRLQAVDAFFNEHRLRADARESLRSMCDLERLVGKVGTMRANPRDLYNLKETAKLIPELKTVLAKAAQHSLLVAKLVEDLSEHVELIADIERTLVDEPPVLMDDGGYIRTGLSGELDELRALSTSGKHWISQLQETERERTGISSLKIKYNRVFGYYIEISKSNLAAAPQDYIRKQTLANAERFVTPELKEYEEKVLGAQEKILRIEQDLFVALRERVFTYVGTLQTTARALAELDVLSSLAELATSRRYARPQLVENGSLLIKQGRHPVIEQLISTPYIPNDVDLTSDEAFILLTGPNMSGKSSFLRQTALITLLAQIGSYVPAEEMSWTPVDRIFTRVGASDNLAAGRSTFMVEMQEAAYILHQATDKSLIILDELGRGTSTYDGLSLAWAITEFVHDELKAKTLFATHYHELIEVVDKLPHAANFCVAVAEEPAVAGGHGKVVFLHQVLKGGISKSYGIEVAKLAGLPAHLIMRSKDILQKLEQHAWENGTRKRQQSLPLMPVAKPAAHAVVNKLKQMDINQITPLQALQILNEIKGEIES